MATDTVLSPDKELTITRVLNAPIDLVWNVWTDPEFSNTNGNGIGTTDINQTPPTKFYGGSITVTF